MACHKLLWLQGTELGNTKKLLKPVTITWEKLKAAKIVLNWSYYRRIKINLQSKIFFGLMIVFKGLIAHYVNILKEWNQWDSVREKVPQWSNNEALICFFPGIYKMSIAEFLTHIVVTYCCWNRKWIKKRFRCNKKSFSLKMKIKLFPDNQLANPKEMRKFCKYASIVCKTFRKMVGEISLDWRL